MPCTTILVGKKASYNGATVMARNEDCGPGHYDPKKCIVMMPESQPKKYISASGKVTVELPENPMRYTAVPNAIPDEGIWGACGINEENIAMTATETITSNARVQAADPLVNDGIGEEDFVTIVLPYIHSAREGVVRMGMLLEKYGTYEMNGIGFQDEHEIWWLETIGGHHFIAKRVPDDSYVIMPNQQGIDSFDFTDAFGEKKEHICSNDMIEFIENNCLDVAISKSETKLADCRAFDVRGAFGSRHDADHAYNTPRAWFMGRYLNPSLKWDGADAQYNPESDNIPWSFVPERKVTIEDIKYVLSSYYQGTPYNVYASKTETAGKYRPIGINRTNFMGITVLNEKDPDEFRGVEWIAMGCNAFNAAFPLFTNVAEMPEYISNTSARVTTENFYWSNRIIAAMADRSYKDCIVLIERYQNKVASKGHEILIETRNAITAGEKAQLRGEKLSRYLEEQNQKICDFVQSETENLLKQVLKKASDNMLIDYARADG